MHKNEIENSCTLSFTVRCYNQTTPSSSRSARSSPSYPLLVVASIDDQPLHSMSLLGAAHDQHDVHHTCHQQHGQHVQTPVDHTRNDLQQITRTSTQVAVDIVCLLARIEDHQTHVEQRCVDDEAADGRIVQQNVVSIDELVVIDEEVSLDRCPGGENDAENEEGVVDENPHWTETGMGDEALLEKGESEGQLGEDDEQVDDEKDAEDLVDQSHPFEMEKAREMKKRAMYAVMEDELHEDGAE